MEKRLIPLSKFVSYVLRHQPQSIGLTLDREGWASMSALLTLSASKCPELTEEALRSLVAQNEKKRFEISADGLRIRAVQGHSTDAVQRQFKEKVPPVVLYHGTAERNLASILKKGLKAQSRHHVHLSSTAETARAVGARHGKPVVLLVDAKGMLTDGLKFYQAENGVWLTDSVAPRYLTFPQLVGKGT